MQRRGSVGPTSAQHCGSVCDLGPALLGLGTLCLGVPTRKADTHAVGNFAGLECFAVVRPLGRI
jgi:hypothetical protein